MPSLPPILRSLRTTSNCALVQLLDGGVAVRRLVDVVAGVGQRADEPAAQRIVIVGYENPTHTARPLSVVTARAAGTPPSCGTGYFEQLVIAGHRQRRPGTACRRPAARVDVDAPVVRVDDLADDGQAEAGALRLGREERAEDRDPMTSGGMPGPSSVTSTCTIGRSRPSPPPGASSSGSVRARRCRPCRGRRAPRRR